MLHAGASHFAAARGERERDDGAGMGGAGRAGERRGSARDREARSGSKSGSEEKSVEQDIFVAVDLKEGDMWSNSKQPEE